MTDKTDKQPNTDEHAEALKRARARVRKVVSSGQFAESVKNQRDDIKAKTTKRKSA